VNEIENVNFLPKDNSVIEKYLEDYIKMKNPGFAVFLCGPWGSGKTWFINQFKKQKGESKFIHISLYGVATENQMTEQIIQKLYPKIKSKHSKLILKGIRVFTKKWVSLEEIDFDDYLKLSQDKIYIFDDLERCIDPNVALGVISRFVEHSGNNVIIIGEEEYLNANYAEFLSHKEKTIGRHFTIHPDFRAAFDSITNSKNHIIIKKWLM
jgi:DNA polymerase III delta prime subunit